MSKQQLTNGEKMKAARQSLELTQAQLADELGVKANTVYRWESGILDVPKIAELAVETLVSRAKKRSGKKASKKSGKKSASQ
jgi:DNA-binding transcriptional regulator YiaG